MGTIRKILDRLFGNAGRPQEPQAYYHLPGSRQWSPRARKPVDKTKWKPCEGCARPIPVELDMVMTTDGRIEEANTWTYVCPFCSHCHVGAPSWDQDTKTQETCHECSTKLGELYQCSNCSFPRGWMRVECPYCKNHQPVLAPHWVDHCDLFHLECVQCESVFISFCIC